MNDLNSLVEIDAFPVNGWCGHIQDEADKAELTISPMHSQRKAYAKLDARVVKRKYVILYTQ